MLSREYGDLAGAGGVKDVVYQLSKALARWTGRSVKVVIPLYGFMAELVEGFVPVPDPLAPERVLRLDIPMDEPDLVVSEQVSYYYSRRDKVHIYLVCSERFSEKMSVYTYTEEEANGWKKVGAGHHDYFAMNLLLQKSALELAIALEERPDVLHCHDGHTALVPALIRYTPGYSTYFRGTSCLTTIHNAGYGYHQEIADIPYAKSITGLPDDVLAAYQLEEKFDPLLAAGGLGLVNTVSENYAFELQSTTSDEFTGWLGHEFASRGIQLEGITNGIDPWDFSPMDESIPENQRYNPADPEDDLSGKEQSKNNFLEHCGRTMVFDGVTLFGGLSSLVTGPLFTFIGRLSEQKGVDVLLEVLPVFLAQNGDTAVAVLGSGDPVLESRLEALAVDERFAGRVCYLRGFSPELAGVVYRAGDYFVIPSKFEPCGLTDFIAQLYGNIPVVHHVGGLVKVVDGETGVAYKGMAAEDLLGAMNRAVELEKNPAGKRAVQTQAAKTIHQQYTWSTVMHRYLDLYRRS